jgi:hypothetical protein
VSATVVVITIHTHTHTESRLLRSLGGRVPLRNSLDAFSVATALRLGDW